MSQTVVNEFMDQWQKGQIATSHVPRDATFKSESVAAINFGDLLLRGSTDPENGAEEATAAFVLKNIVGIVIKPVSGGRAKRFSDGLLVFNQGDLMTLALEADIAVEIDDTITAGQDAFYVHTGGGASALHTYRKDLDSDKASQVPGTFQQSGVAGDIVLLRFNIDAVLGS